jgi:hypothetical protein
VWSKVGLTVTSGAGGDPEAFTLQKTVNQSYWGRTVTKISPSAFPFTFQAKIKKGVGDFIAYTMQGNGSAHRIRGSFNMVTGAVAAPLVTVGSFSSGAATLSEEDADGFRLLTFSAITDTNSTVGTFIAPFSSANPSAVDIVDVDATANCIIKDVQFENGLIATAPQRSGLVGTDITEIGVPSFDILSFDGSDDALMQQIHTGGTVAVAIFGRSGSYLIPSITFTANDVLQMGPLSIFDNGVVIPGSPTNLIRALGSVPWSSKFEMIGPPVIMKANPDTKERFTIMRQRAARGAKGWLVEGSELLTNGGLNTDLTGWGGYGSVRTWESGTARVVADALNFPRFFNTTAGWQIPRNTLIYWQLQLI